MAPTVDVNQQTGADMNAARSRTSISVHTVRNFLYGEIFVFVLVTFSNLNKADRRSGICVNASKIFLFRIRCSKSSAGGSL
jgi:hypothetical protein